MAQLLDICPGPPRFPKSRLAWIAAAPLLILPLPARSGESLKEAPSRAVEAPVPATTAPISGTSTVPVPISGTSTAPDTTQAAAIVTPAETRPESGDQQRRVLMLLLMNSAGPVRPYGNLGR